MAIIKINEVKQQMLNERFLNDIHETAMGLPDPEEQKELKHYVIGKANDFIHRCEIVQEEEEFGPLLMWFYIQLKSEWSQINTEVQYQPLRSDMPDMMLIFKASVLSQLLANVEEMLSYSDVERATDFIADPIWKVESMNSFEVNNEQQEDLIYLSEDLQAAQIRVFEDIQKTAAMLSDIQNVNGEYTKLKNSLEQLDSRFRALTQNSNTLRLGIIELRQVKARNLYDRLERFFNEAQQTYGVWGEFSIGGENILIERKVVETLLEPFARLLRICLSIASGFDLQISFRLRVRYSGRMLKVGLSVDSDNTDFLSTLAAIPNRTDKGVLESIYTSLTGIGGTFETVQKNEHQVELLTVLPNRANVMEEAIIFESGNMTCGIPRGLVSQMVSITPEKLKSVKGYPTLVERGEVYPFLALNSLLNPFSTDKENVAILLQYDKNTLALGVKKVETIETVSLQPLGAYEEESPLVKSIGMTGSGQILNFLDMGMLFDMQTAPDPTSKLITT